MNVLIALASSSGQLSGVQRHALNLARCLLTREEIRSVHLVAAPWQQEFVHGAAPIGDPRLHLHAAPIGNSSLSRNRWFYTQLPKLAAQLKTDLVHLAYPVPARKHAYRCPTVVTLHDLYPYDIPENFGFPKVLFNRAVLRQCLRSVDAIACVSASTLTRLKELDAKHSFAKASVIYNSVEAPPPAPLQVSLPNWSRDLSHPFVLCVAQHRRNKNILLALRIFARLIRSGNLPQHARMLVLGNPGPETPAIHNFLTDSGLAEQVILRNGISDTDLQWCYRNCALLLAPSVIEGFGLPVAEALLAGCRVVCSDIPAFRELGGQHCHYVPLEPHDEEAFVKAIRAALDSPAPLPVPLPQLSASIIGAKYLDLYRSLLPSLSIKQDPHPIPLQAAEERPHTL